MQGIFWEYWVRCRHRDDGTVVMASWVINASFLTQWTNPLWEQLGLRVDAEGRRVVEKVRLTVEKLRPLPDNFGVIDDASLQRDLGVGLRPGAFFIARPVRSCLLIVVLGLLLIVCLRRCGLVLRALTLKLSYFVGCLPQAAGLHTVAVAASEALAAPEPASSHGNSIVEAEADYINVTGQ